MDAVENYGVSKILSDVTRSIPSSNAVAQHKGTFARDYVCAKWHRMCCQLV